MFSARDEEKLKLERELKKHVDAFLVSGGQITQLDNGVSGMTDKSKVHLVLQSSRQKAKIEAGENV